MRLRTRCLSGASSRSDLQLRPGFSAPAQRSGQSHEFSVTVGAEKTLVIVTGYGFEEFQA